MDFIFFENPFNLCLIRPKEVTFKNQKKSFLKPKEACSPGI
jgi:hypothetical protein